MILYKNVPGKKYYYSRKCMVTITMIPTLQQEKMGLILKTPLALFDMQVLRIKSPFYENLIFTTFRTFFLVLFFLGYISFSTLIPAIIFLETLIMAASILFEKKSPRNLKLRILFPVTFCLRT